MTAHIISDWHIHSQYSCDSACMSMQDLAHEPAKAGVLAHGVTDHLHTPYNFPDLIRSRQAYDALQYDHFHFGVEVSCVSLWEIEKMKNEKIESVYGIRSGGPIGGACAVGLSGDDIQRLKVEYVIGGTHWPMYVPYTRDDIIRDYHRQNMFLASQKEIDIVAHPWWWMGHWQENDGSYQTDPWFSDFSMIPNSFHDEFAHALIANHKSCELNLKAMVLNQAYPMKMRRQYMEYMRNLFEKGVKITLGSDCHEMHYEDLNESVSSYLEQVGFKSADFSSPTLRQYVNEK